MITKVIIINSISSDKQNCKDVNGKRYSIIEIGNYMNMTNVDINVHVVKNPNGSKYSYSIRYKKNCKVQTLKAQTPKRQKSPKEETEKYAYGNRNSKCLEAYFVIEDSSSAKEIIKNIAKKFAENSKISLSIHYIFAGGVGYIPEALRNCIPNKAKVLVMYDSALKDAQTLKKIEGEIKHLTRQKNIEFITFTPKCIEECALSFNKLKTEIKGLTQNQKDLLNAIDTYRRTGKDYISYDVYGGQYNINGTPIKFGYTSKFIPKYSKVDTVEKYLADRLAEMTCRKPYQFIKKANICWYRDCKSNIGRCVYEKDLGTKRPNSPVNYCSMTLKGKDKTMELIQHSLFGILYDAIGLLLFQKALVYNASIYDLFLGRKW